MESVAETKVCTRCGIEKTTDQFHCDRTQKSGRTPACKTCRYAQVNDWRRRNPEKVINHKRDEYHRNRDKYLEYNRSSERRERWFAWKLKRQFGITVDEFEAMLEKQCGCCAICESELEVGKYSNRRLHIDHDHQTGVVRGLLCLRCNTGIGSFGDSPEILANAIDYLLQERIE